MEIFEASLFAVVGLLLAFGTVLVFLLSKRIDQMPDKKKQDEDELAELVRLRTYSTKIKLIEQIERGVVEKQPSRRSPPYPRYYRKKVATKK